jgi:NAD(P)-dependent dehydrogenase (short-subunit alcohol dehydrogenase family)
MSVHVLIVGAGGVFGSRLARLLARRGGYRLSLGGRSEARLVPLQRELRAIHPDGEFAYVHIDREQASAERLKEIGCAIVVDCSGPFQLSSTKLIEAAIGARVHYLDLADSRAFVTGISRFDSPARAVGIAVISGVSSTPALTHAVLDSLTSAWLTVDSVDVAIIPGNRTPKGKSVIDGILSWVGQKIRVYRDGAWQEARGWAGRRTVTIEGLKPRSAYLADVPDLDLLPRRYQPRVRAGFEAGMELGVLNWLIGMAGLMVRWRMVKSARVFAGLGTWIAMKLDRFGSTDGGMVVEAAGQDSRGEARVARWTLKAGQGDGPYVPVTPAAALIEALVAGRGIRAGARPAAGELTLDQIRPWFEGLAFELKLVSYRGEKPLYRRVMGEGFDRLPEVTRRLHRGRPASIAIGEAEVEAAANPLGALVAWAFGLPRATGKQPIRVVIESRDGREHWTRIFRDKPMRSIMSAAPGNLIEEQFGPFSLRMRLVPKSGGLDMERVSGRLWGVPLPPFLLPKMTATERVDDYRRHAFDVEIAAPLLGRLVHYKGWLEV